jgi:hypothetical protein
MKKIYASILMCSSIFMTAQNVTLYEQEVNGTSGVVSSFRTIDPPAGVWCSDDFTLTSGGTINKISVSGFSNLGTSFDSAIQGLDLYIYADDGGKPAGHPGVPNSWLLFQTLTPSSAGYNYVIDNNIRRFEIDLEAIGASFVASPNVKYWLSVGPRVNLNIMDGNNSNRWNWYQAAAPTGTSNAHIASTGGLFSLPENQWQNFSAVGLSFFNLAMKIEGTETLSSESFLAGQVKVYPNPTKGIVNINVSNEILVENVSLFNSIGREINVNVMNNQMNISSLPTGVYILNITTNQGQLTRKIVKE